MHWIFISVWYEPTCVDKAVKPIIAGVHPLLTWTSPNLSELRAMYGAVTGKQAKSTHTNGICLIEKVCLHEILISLSPSLSLSLLLLSLSLLLSFQISHWKISCQSASSWFLHCFTTFLTSWCPLGEMEYSLVLERRIVVGSVSITHRQQSVSCRPMSSVSLELETGGCGL